jgi:hypothetical protein
MMFFAEMVHVSSMGAHDLLCAYRGEHFFATLFQG